MGHPCPAPLDRRSQLSRPLGVGKHVRLQKVHHCHTATVGIATTVTPRHEIGRRAAQMIAAAAPAVSLARVSLTPRIVLPGQTPRNRPLGGTRS